MNLANTKCFAFNIWDIESAKAVLDAAKTANKPVILQTSTPVFKQMDVELFAKHIKAYAKLKGVSMLLHLDHCKEVDIIDIAIANGWDSVMIDASHLPLAENIAITNEVTGKAHAHNVLVEAEVGQIQKTEYYIDTAIPTATMTDIEEFLNDTDIDWFAAAIGTAHGLYRGTPDIDYDMINEIGNITTKPFVIHGGTGLTDDVLKKLFTYPNVSKINISTDVKQAYRKGILKAEANGLLAQESFEAVRIEQYIYEEIYNMTVYKLSLIKGN